MPSTKAPRYATALRFIKERAAIGEAVLSVPEDAGLYFLAGVGCPTLVYALTPGWIAEQTIAEIERKRVDYLMWSNRRFPEHGVPEFGQDFRPGAG